jgi:uncharacterized protein
MTMREIRAIVTEARAAGEGADKKVEGLGIIYDRWVEIWPGYQERIRKGAAKAAATVKSYFNHDPSQVLSTTTSKPALELKDSEEALTYSSPIPPTSYGKDLEVNLERGNVRGSSFSFDVPKGGDKWTEDENGTIKRDITELTYYEVGPVTDPAYIQTTAALRSAEAAVEEFRKSKPLVLRNLAERRQKLARLTG